MTALYNYDPLSGEFLSQSVARRDPLDGTPLVPGSATLIAPPVEQDGMVRVFSDGAWGQVEDHRKETYWTGDGVAHEVDDLGPLPEGALTEEPNLPTYPTADAANAAMLVWINRLTASLDAGLTNAEIRAKTKKAAAARAHLMRTATPEQTKMLGDEVALTGETIDALATTIRDKADRDDEIDAQVAGLRRHIRDELNAEDDPFNFEAILSEGMARARALANSLGIEVA